MANMRYHVTYILQTRVDGSVTLHGQRTYKSFSDQDVAEAVLSNLRSAGSADLMVELAREFPGEDVHIIEYNLHEIPA
jgi:hypothetical protein